MSKSVGDYMLKDKIGKGSYADVYKGYHKTTSVKHAIKVIFKENLSDPKLLQGLESEIRIMREFNHENIVKLYEYFSSEKNFYLVLELCEGGDLSKFIKKRKRLSERVAHSFLLQLANGLSFLQERNFIHRDLKPANVLLTESSEDAVLKLADFGFARHLTAATLAQTRCGTPLYMAPEILESRDYDGKADIWSVGCILYEMLVGVYPFKGMNEADLLNNIKTKELTIPKDVEVSKPSIDVLIKLLERNPMRRASVEQLSIISTQLVKFSGGTARDAALFPEGYSFAGAGGAVGGEQQSSEGKRSGSGDAPSPAAAAIAAAAGGTGSGGTSVNLSPMGSGAAGAPGAVSRQTERAAINPSTATTMIMTKVAAYGTPDSHPRRYSEDLTQTQQPQGMSNSFVRDSRMVDENNGGKQQHQGTPPQSNMMSPQQQLPPQQQQQQTPTGGAVAALGAVGKAIAFVLSPTTTPQDTATPVRTNSGRSFSLEEEKGRYMQQHAHIRSGEFTPSANSNTSMSSLPPTPKIQTPDGAGYMRGSNAFMLNSNYPSNPPLSLDPANNRYRSNSVSFNTGGINSPPPFGVMQSSNSDGRGVTPTNAESAPFGLNSSEEEGFVVIESSSYPEGQLGRQQFFDKAGNRVSYGQHQGAYLSNKGGLVSRKAPLPPHLMPQPISVASNAGAGGGVNASNAVTSNAAMLDAQLSHYFMELTGYSKVYFKAVHHITLLGDQYIQESVDLKSERSGRSSLTVKKSTLSLCKLSVDDTILLQSQGVSYKEPMLQLDRCVIASILYFHSLSLMKTFMNSFNADMAQLTHSPSSTPKHKEMLLNKLSINHQHTYNAFKKDFASLFAQIVERVEGCQSQIKELLLSNGDIAKLLKFNEVSAESILMHMAKVREEDAAIEELRNIRWAGRLYHSAVGLVEAVLITTVDPEHAKRLREYVTKLNEKYDVCKERAEEVGEVW